MSTSTVPSSFKEALVTPLLKKTFIGQEHGKKLQTSIKPRFCVEGPGTCGSNSTDEPPLIY